MALVYFLRTSSPDSYVSKNNCTFKSVGLPPLNSNLGTFLPLVFDCDQLLDLVNVYSFGLNRHSIESFVSRLVIVALTSSPVSMSASYAKPRVLSRSTFNFR